MTNFEAMKQKFAEMTIDEMAKWLSEVYVCDMCASHGNVCTNEICIRGVGQRRWLEQEAGSHEEHKAKEIEANE